MPSNDWKLTSHNLSEALWLNDEKIIENDDGNITIKVACFFQKNLPFGLTDQYINDFLSGAYQSKSTLFYSCQKYKVYTELSEEGETFFSAMCKSEGGYISRITAMFPDNQGVDAKSMFDQLLAQSKMLDLKEMDEEYGYPLNPEVDNNEFIKRRKEHLLDFYRAQWGSSLTLEELDKSPLEEIVPELYDGFSFERLFSTWNTILGEELDINEFFDVVFLDKETPDLQLYFKYVYDHSGDFYDLDVPLLRNQSKTNIDAEKYFNENAYWADSYEVCGDSGTLSHVWRTYFDSTETTFILVCFHKNGEALSSDADWKIDWIGATEYKVDEMYVGPFWHAQSLDIDSDCANEVTNLVGFTALNSDSVETTFVGSPYSINTSVVPLRLFQPKRDEVHYTVYAFNSLRGRANRPTYSEYANISDSVGYDCELPKSFQQEFDRLSSLKQEDVLKEIDPLFVESFQGNHGCETIECDQEERPYLYALNSKVFNLPPEKRTYSTPVIHEDLNRDGRVDAYLFSVSNGEIVGASIVYDMGYDVEAETNVEKYFEQFKKSEKGRFLIRVSMHEKNLLPIWVVPFSRDDY